MRTEHDGEEQATLFERLLGGFVGWVCRWPLLMLAFALVTGGGSLCLAGQRLQFHTQRSDLISPKKDYVQRWQKYLAEFGDDDDIVVVVQGADPSKMKQALEQIAGQIAQHPQL